MNCSFLYEHWLWIKEAGQSSPEKVSDLVHVPLFDLINVALTLGHISSTMPVCGPSDRNRWQLLPDERKYAKLDRHAVRYYCLSPGEKGLGLRARIENRRKSVETP